MTAPTDVAGLIREAAGSLRSAGVEPARREAELLLQATLGLRRERLIAEPHLPVATADAVSFRCAVERRARHEPLAYITGHREFMSLDLIVSPAVLIPRPETEVLVEGALSLLGVDPAAVGAGARDSLGRRRLAAAARPAVVDVGTGSGAVALAVAHYCPSATVWAVDISAGAAAVARANAARLGLEERVSIHVGDLLEVDGLPTGRAFDLVLANLPYIPEGRLECLASEVSAFEPRLALDGGDDGLRQIARLIPQAARHLRPGGALGLECDPEQCTLLSGYLASAGFAATQVLSDLAGRGRTVWGFWGG